MPVRPVLHGDNGATLKATTVLAMLHWLGIKPSYSRPRVSDDNAFAEALLRTAKYRPEFRSRASSTWTTRRWVRSPLACRASFAATAATRTTLTRSIGVSEIEQAMQSLREPGGNAPWRHGFVDVGRSDQLTRRLAPGERST